MRPAATAIATVHREPSVAQGVKLAAALGRLRRFADEPAHFGDRGAQGDAFADACAGGSGARRNEERGGDEYPPVLFGGLAA